MPDSSVPSMCLLAFLRRVFIGSVPPNPESFLSPEDEQRAAQQAYVSLGKPGSLGFFRRVSTTSARLAPLRSPSCLGGQRDVP